MIGVVGFLSVAGGALFTAAVCLSLGRLLFRRLGIELRRTEHDLLAGTTGASLLSLLVFLLCAARIAYAPVFLLVGVAALWFGMRSPAGRESLPALSGFRKYLFLAAFAGYALLYLSNSLAPEHSPDGSSYHLGLVARYLREHGFVRITTSIYANLSQGMEMLFLFAFAFGRHSAAATVHCFFLLTLPLLMLSYARRIGHPGAGVAAAMLVYLSPVAGIDGVSAYNDVALATVAFALYYLLEIWREDGDDRLMVPIGLLAGFCFAIKYTGVAAGFYMLLVLATSRASGRGRRVCLAGVAAAVMALPWPIRNWIWLGNPLSPFFNTVFRNPYVHITFENTLRTIFQTYLLPSLKPLFRIVTVTGETGGQIGPLFLLAPVALLALRHRAGRRCLAAAVFFLATYPSNIGTRFLIPALPFVAFAMALALEFSAPLLAAIVMAALVLAWPRVIDKYRAPAGTWQIAHMPWQAALQIVPPAKYLESHWSGYALAERINRVIPKNRRLWSTVTLPEAYTDRTVLLNFASAEGEKIEDILQTPVVQDLQPLWNLRFRFPARRLSRLRIAQTAVKESDTWSIGEARFFLGEKEVKTARVSAQPFPWDIGYAFDGNPVTRWRAWEPMRSGQHVDVDFGGAAELDRVELYCSHDQWDVKVHLEGGDLERQARFSQEHLPPGRDLRRLATGTIKSLGVSYLLIGAGYETAADMRQDPARWGLGLLAEFSDGDRIYEIQ